MQARLSVSRYISRQVARNTLPQSGRPSPARRAGLSRADVTGADRRRQLRRERRPLLSVRDAAAFLSMSPSWLYQSDIPFVRLGQSSRRYRLKDLLPYVEQRLSHGVEGEAS